MVWAAANAAQRKMTRAAKITYVAALFIGLSIGGIFGFQTDTSLLKAYFTVRHLTAPMIFSRFSYLQYNYAETEHAQAALQTFAGFLEQLERLSPERMQEQDLTFTYTRLALLADAADRPEQAHALMTKAHYWYVAGGGRGEYSESELKANLNALDDHLQR
jgi:hypothetical protein